MLHIIENVSTLLLFAALLYGSLAVIARGLRGPQDRVVRDGPSDVLGGCIMLVLLGFALHGWLR